VPTYSTSRNPAYSAGAAIIEHSVALTAATTTAAGGVASIANPLGVALIILDVILNITTQSSGAAAVDAGVAANGSTTSDTLIDGLSVATAGVFSQRASGGTNGAAPRRWGASEYVTATASATTAGMVGTITLICARA
jgi:hypothetical protein